MCSKCYPHGDVTRKFVSVVCSGKENKSKKTCDVNEGSEQVIYNFVF